jgi:hypothetical protein
VDLSTEEFNDYEDDWDDEEDNEISEEQIHLGDLNIPPRVEDATKTEVRNHHSVGISDWKWGKAISKLPEKRKHSRKLLREEELDSEVIEELMEMNIND